MIRPSHSQIVKRAARMQKSLPRFDFGKYKGIPVSDVFRDNPAYVVWCWENFRDRNRLPFIEELYVRAKAIVEEMGSADELHELDLWAMDLANE